MSTPSPDPTLPPVAGERRRLPATRSGITHKFSIAGFEGYLTANTYEDGSLGELFIKCWPCSRWPLRPALNSDD